MALELLKQSVGDAGDAATREHVYAGIRAALVRGRFAPGEKLVLRQLAAEFNVSLTPVREAMHRLIAEGVVTHERGRSVRVPVLTREKILELRDIRMTLECLAVERGAARATEAEVRALERLTEELYAARRDGDVARDSLKVAEFQFMLYGMSKMGVLVRHIEMLWQQTGPYIRFLYPEYIKRVQQVRPTWRFDLCDALRKHDVATARRLIEPDIYEALTFLSDLVDAASKIRPA